ncbi:hypothetical protein BDV97DRAFT_401030 [Delphinella strobiligena]|nr:hypothetical protein BDV97DRAFT_401030 [Delphinella strobiligena]
MPSVTPVRAFMRTFQTAFRSTHAPRNASTLVHKHDNMLYVRKLGRTAAVFFPFYAVVLGWPFLVSGYAKHVGV